MVDFSKGAPFTVSSQLYLPPDLLITFENSLDPEFRLNEMLGSKLFYTGGIPERFYFYDAPDDTKKKMKNFPAYANS